MTRTAISTHATNNRKSQVVGYEPPVLCGLLNPSRFSIADTMIGEIRGVIKMRMPPPSVAGQRNVLDTASRMTYHVIGSRAV